MFKITTTRLALAMLLGLSMSPVMADQGPDVNSELRKVHEDKQIQKVDIASDCHCECTQVGKDDIDSYKKDIYWDSQTLLNER